MRTTRFLIVAVLLAAGASWAGEGIRLPMPPIPGVNMPLPLPPVPGVSPKHLYRYFPDREVYFDPAKSLYFFFDADVWRSAPMLPPHLVVQGLPFIELDIDDDSPHRHHGEVRKHYPRGYKKHKGDDGDDRQGRGHDKKRGRGHDGGRGRGHGDD